MSWEFDDKTPAEEPKDRTKLVWGGIAIAFVVMIGILATLGGSEVVGQSRVYVKHIVITFDIQSVGDRDRAFELAARLRERIVSGEASFEDVARDYSADEGTGRPGHMGWLTRDDIAEGAAADFIWKGPVGELSELIESNVGFHLIYVDERRLSEAEQFERELDQKVFGEDGRQ